MQARAPLMMEHRLIEKMLNVIQKKVESVEKTQSMDPYFVDMSVDFLRVYADRTHHGKEEEIMFRALRGKQLSDEDRQMMDELMTDHTFSRNNTKVLLEANDRYRKGDSQAIGQIITCLKTMVDFYPKHIQKEDALFFPASRNYFSEEEDQAMLAEFWEFDRKLIHEKYKAVLKNFEAA